MRKIILTDKALKALKPAAAGKRYVVWDTLTPGFGVRVTESGHATFLVRRRRPGDAQPIRRRIGDYPGTTLENARKLARGALETIVAGKDPRDVRREQEREAARRRKETFDVVADDFVKRHVKKLNGGRGLELWDRIVERELKPAWGKRPIAGITRADVVELVEEIVERDAPAQAHNVLSCARRLFNWAINRDVYGLEHSPCDRLKPKDLIGAKVHRTRVLRDDELRLLWRAAPVLEYPFGPFTRLLLVTGQRLREVADAHRAELHLGEKLWTIPAERMKGDRAHEVPLSALALELLSTLPKWSAGDYLFSGSGGEKPVSGFSNAKERLDMLMSTAKPPEGGARESGLREWLASDGAVASGCVLDMFLSWRSWRAARRTEPAKRPDGVREFVEELRRAGYEVAPPQHWTWHDLRRTMRTHLSALPVQDIVRELVIAHARPGLHKVYDQHAYREEKRQALEQWAERLRGIVEPPPANVVQLRRAARKRGGARK